MDSSPQRPSVAQEPRPALRQPPSSKRAWQSRPDSSSPVQEDLENQFLPAPVKDTRSMPPHSVERSHTSITPSAKSVRFNVDDDQRLNDHGPLAVEPLEQSTSITETAHFRRPGVQVRDEAEDQPEVPLFARPSIFDAQVSLEQQRQDLRASSSRKGLGGIARYPAEIDRSSDQTALLGAVPQMMNNRSYDSTHHKRQTYVTFPETIVKRTRDPDSWKSVAKLSIYLLFILCFLFIFMSAYIRYVDPHEGLESRQHQLEHRQWDAERKKEEQRRTEERKRWAEEEERENVRMRQKMYEWDEMRRVEGERRKGEREEWSREREAEREEQRRERGRWEMEKRIEKERMAAEREEWEAERRDAERWRYQHSGAFWTQVVMGKCASFGVRQYSALLENVPNGYDRHKICDYTNVTIHNHVYEHPNWCDDQGDHGIRGYWWVNSSDSGELGCRPYWDIIADKGCTGPGSGKHRYESSLHGLVKGESWEALCASVPATIEGLTYDNPTHCEYRGGDVIWGLWDVNDPSCEGSSSLFLAAQ